MLKVIGKKSVAALFMLLSCKGQEPPSDNCVTMASDPQKWGHDFFLNPNPTETPTTPPPFPQMLGGFIEFAGDQLNQKGIRGKDDDAKPISYRKTAAFDFFYEGTEAPIDLSSITKIYFQAWTTSLIDIYSGTNYHLAIAQDSSGTTPYSSVPVRLTYLQNLYEVINNSQFDPTTQQRQWFVSNFFKWGFGDLQKLMTTRIGTDSQLCPTLISENYYCSQYAATQMISGYIDFSYKEGTTEPVDARINAISEAERLKLKTWIVDYTKKRNAAYFYYSKFNSTPSTTATSFLGQITKLRSLYQHIEEFQKYLGYAGYYEFITGATEDNAFLEKLDNESNSKIVRISAASPSQSIILKNFNPTESKITLLNPNMPAAYPDTSHSIGPITDITGSSAQERYKSMVTNLGKFLLEEIIKTHTEIATLRKDTTLPEELKKLVTPNVGANLIDFNDSAKKQSYSYLKDFPSLLAVGTKGHHNISLMKEEARTGSPSKFSLQYDMVNGANSNFNICNQWGSMLTLGGVFPLQAITIPSKCDETGGGIETTIPEVSNYPEVPAQTTSGNNDNKNPVAGNTGKSTSACP